MSDGEGGMRFGRGLVCGDLKRGRVGVWRKGIRKWRLGEEGVRWVW